MLEYIGVIKKTLFVYLDYILLCSRDSREWYYKKFKTFASDLRTEQNAE